MKNINELKQEAIRRGFEQTPDSEVGLTALMENIEKEWEIVKRDNPASFEKQFYTDEDFKDIEVTEAFLEEHNLVAVQNHVMKVDDFTLGREGWTYYKRDYLIDSIEQLKSRDVEPLKINGNDVYVGIIED